ncbi:hypothetical protein HLB23_06020 [Nocardia uniformis]|uniref:Uncharacterized protein n=1 Tax=Nocardia uniformis TaxID=53432 RepID=A0A849C380_9NOCA|nr:hypothetical protein [Nocardia uniformis]NNH69429.1 hypothetical protein [Nocardia uniformis]
MNTDRGDAILSVVLDVIGECDGTFTPRQVVSAARPLISPAPTLGEVEGVFQILEVPALNGVVAVGRGIYRAGATTEVVAARLSRLAAAAQDFEDDDGPPLIEYADDRY